MPAAHEGEVTSAGQEVRPPREGSGQDAKPTFNDTKKYWYEELPNHGVKLPGVGVKIQVLTEEGTSMRVKFS